MTERRTLSLPKLFGFSILATFGVLFGLNLLVEEAEDAGVVNTTESLGPTQMVVEELFRQVDGHWETTPYGQETMVRTRVPVDRGDTLRVAVVGGSWAMGSPYIVQNAVKKGGGISSYLQSSLSAATDRPVEVINAAAGGQDSHRVKDVAAEVVKLEPDALVVATCNNEGTPSSRPSHVQRFLAKQASVRLLMTLGREPQRSWFTAQDPDTERIREAYVANLESIVASAKRASVPVLLATLPVNLDYAGFDLGHVDVGRVPATRTAPPELLGETEALPAGFEHPSVDPCVGGIRLSEIGRSDLAIPLLQRCVADPSAEMYWKQLSVPTLAVGRLMRGEAVEGARAELAARFSPCVADGIVDVLGGRGDQAEATLRGCTEDVAESLRWVGFALAKQGKNGEAADALRQSLELKPRNRCRPTFNDAIRAVAARHDHVTLVDLERRAEELGPPPGPEPWFIDYCHMSWRGYGAMGRELHGALAALPGTGITGEPLSDEGFRQAWDLPAGDGTEQWRALLSGWFSTPSPTPPPAQTPPPR